MTQSVHAETHGFQTEVKQLLSLMAHSLYSNKEVFLRELISNASDAADKLRFEALKEPGLLEEDPTLRIRIGFDADARTVTIDDNGIGMSRDEAVAHLGTIAKSGTGEFLRALSGDQKKDANLIGQFGVGFYSGFIVADRIVVESRRAGLPATDGVRWSSGGSGDFEVETIERAARGTSVILHLREDATEYLSHWKLKQIIGKYSDHISLPILMQKEEWDAEKSEYVTQDAWEAVNSASALWTRAKKDISDEQYADFYKAISYDQADPLTWSHNRVEGNQSFSTLLYLPAQPPFDLLMGGRDERKGLKLSELPALPNHDEQTVLRCIRILRLAVAAHHRRQDNLLPEWKVQAAEDQLVVTLPTDWCEENRLLIQNLEKEHR